MDFAGGFDGSQGAVLKGFLRTKNGQDRITNIFFDKPIIFFDDLSQLGKDGARDFFDLFRIESFGHLSVARKIGKHDSYASSFAVRRFVNSGVCASFKDRLAALGCRFIIIGRYIHTG